MVRSAIITGGTGAIGLSIAHKLLSDGLSVALIGSSLKSGDKAQELLEIYPSACSFWVCDLGNLEDINSCINKIYGAIGSVDILVNCAGLLETYDPEELSEEVWDQVIDVNLKSYFFVIQSCLPYLKNGQSPRIVNVSSNAGRMGGYANGAAYAASKGGVISLTYNLARKLAKFGITVNCVAPGTIETEMIQQLSNSMKQNLIEKFPVGRFGTGFEVASAVNYFVMESSSFTTGAVLDVNGGLFTG
jgi:3-oxoacyl-[acyl-carrier protein] reductase